MSNSTKNYPMGWIADYPDFRDYHRNSPEIAESLKMALPSGVSPLGVPERVDLSYWCSPVEHQQCIGSCTAQAGTGMVEYFVRKSFGDYTDFSRLFLYKATRNLLNWKGDTGAYLRTTMKALALFGIAPEKYWPYNIKQFDEEPPAFCYAFAQNYQALEYYRLDQSAMNRDDLLNDIKESLASGLPLMFGFSVFDSIEQAEFDGKIPFPINRDKYKGGHAVMCVGYDDDIVIKNHGDLALETKGAFRIRNSWGKEWGEEGYGWLPYEYLMRGMAIDWWSLIEMEWLDLGVFGEEFMNTVELMLPDAEVIERAYKAGREKVRINVPGLGKVEGEIGECPNSRCKKMTCVKGSVRKWIFTVNFEYCPSCGHLKISAPLGTMQDIKDKKELPMASYQFPVLEPEMLKAEAPAGEQVKITTPDGLPITGTIVECPRCGKNSAIKGTIKLGFLSANIIYCPACGFLKVFF